MAKKISIIAEFCQNHNGDYNILNQMIEKAVESGATHGKIQNIFAKELTFRPCFENEIKIKNKIVSIKRPYKNEYERLKKLELNYKQLENFVKKCKAFKLIPLITCFTRNQINLLSKIGFKTIKIASYDCSSFQFLREIVKKFNNLIVSTGATYNDEIYKAAKILKKKNFSFLHCVTIYPTPLNDINLNRMIFLKKFTKEVGYSDHAVANDKNLIAIKLAILMGAKIIEKHFTILDSNKTRDGIVSMNPNQLYQISEFSKLNKNDQKHTLKEASNRLINKICGKQNRKMSNIELLNRNYYKGRFGSIVNKNDGRKHIFNWEEI